MPDRPRIVCVSNRLPVSAHEEPDKIQFQPSSGGLVTALGPVLRKERGVWIGWPGAVTSSEAQVRQALADFSSESEFELYPILLDQASRVGFYQGFSNQIIWPLFHDLQSRCNFDPTFWSTYLHVQSLFADEVRKRIKPSDFIWVHDYHLMGLGRVLRQAETNNKICFFLHTPFPSPDIFLKLPWRSDVLNSLLSYNLVGFQTKHDLKNFVDCVGFLTDLNCSNRGELLAIRTNELECLLGHFPISIDFNEFEDVARSTEVETNAQKIRSDMNSEFLILSIDRLDYTKGIPYRIRAFRRLFELDPTLKKRIALLQVIVPSRVEVPEYAQLRLEIEQLVSQLNGDIGEPGWVPVQHLFRMLTKEEVIAMYRASDVALVTPLKDGMNLVAKEYCASRINNGGALVLSEFAGAAAELKHAAFLVNPYDIDGVARALGQALATTKDASQERMREMRDIVRKADVFNWATSFLKSAGWEGTLSGAVARPTTVWERLRRIANVFDM